MELLNVEKLSKRFYKNKVAFHAVDQVSFQLAQGECMALVGESGCGKSTTANMIARLLKETSGTITFGGRRITAGLTLTPVGRDLQMIFQNPVDSFDPRDTVLRGVMQGALSYRLFPRSELEQQALELFDYVGLKRSYASRRIGELSGGECQRAAVARALICRPKLLICDEATSALDVLVQAQIVALLRRLKQERNLSLLFITHDLPLAAALCDRVAVMHQGRIVEMGPTREVLHHPQAPQTKHLLETVLTLDRERADL